MICKHPVAAYAVLACVFSWSWWLPMALRGDIARSGVGWPTHLPGLLGPALAAVVITALVDGREGLRGLWSRVTRWRIGWRWWALVAATAGLAVLGLLLPAATGDSMPALADFARYSGAPEINLLFVVLVVLVVNGYGEEIGWRGFAVDRLARTHGLLITALMVAGMWAVWHLPLFLVVANLRGLGVLGGFGWLVGLTSGSVVLTWMYLRSGSSITLVAAWHTSFNLTTATAATAGTVAATSSTLVMVGAVAIVATQFRTKSRNSSKANHQPSTG